MSNFNDNDRSIKVTAPARVFLADRLEGEEFVSAPFEFRLRMRSTNPTIAPGQLVGQPMAVTVNRTDGSRGVRHFHGVVARFENLGLIDRDHHMYTAVLRPWFWLLSHTADCRIFQHKSALEIVRSVLAEGGFGPVEEKVRTPPPPREYCVQYNETDFAFVSRLLEEEGIFYCFRHEAGRHVMVLSDDVAALPDAAEPRASFRAKLSAGAGADRLTAWAHGYELRPGRWAHTDYDFEAPASNLAAQVAAPGATIPLMPNLEVFEWPGVYKTADVGRQRAAVRAEQAVVGYDSVRGGGACEAFAAGTRFAVGEHHTAAEVGKRYVLTEVRHRAQQMGTYAGGGDPAAWAAATAVGGNGHAAEPPYANTFVAIPAESKLRPPRTTPKPRIPGPQTAVVVGPPGEEIWPDKHGRVKVQFHWDRYGKRDQNSSCWIRVAYLAAGGGFGMTAIPRVGHEVVVEFLDGDPDRPLVTGSVYNAAKAKPISNAGRKTPAPPDVPATKMMTTLRSNSLGGSGGHNEITMNDTGGAEGLFLKAQKDEVHNVGNDREDTVGNNEVRKVAVNRSREVGNNETVKVGVNRDKTIGVDETIKVGSNRTTTIGVNETVKVGANCTTTVGANDSLTVMAMRMQKVAIAENMTTGISRTIQTGVARIETTGLLNVELTGLKRIGLVGLSDTLGVGLTKSDTIGTDYTISVGSNTALDTGSDLIVTAGANAGVKAAGMVVVESPDITLKAGGSFIRITASEIVISGPKVMINSGGSAGSLPDKGGGAGAAGAAGGAAGGAAAGGSGAGGAAGAAGSAGAAGAGSAAGGAAAGGGLLGSLGIGEGGALGKIGEALGKIPGLESIPGIGAVLDTISKGDLPSLQSVLSALPAGTLSPKAQKYMNALMPVVNQYAPSAKEIQTSFGGGGNKGGGGTGGGTSGGGGGGGGGPPTSPGSGGPVAGGGNQPGGGGGGQKGGGGASQKVPAPGGTTGGGTPSGGGSGGNPTLPFGGGSSGGGGASKTIPPSGGQSPSFGGGGTGGGGATRGAPPAGGTGNNPPTPGKPFGGGGGGSFGGGGSSGSW